MERRLFKGTNVSISRKPSIIAKRHHRQYARVQHVHDIVGIVYICIIHVYILAFDGMDFNAKAPATITVCV